MKFLYVLLIVPLLLAATTAPATKPADANEAVVAIARSFKDGGGYDKSGGTGAPEEVRFKSIVILSKGKSGTYCSGFTFAVVMRAATRLHLIDGKSLDEIKKFHKQWYGYSGDAVIDEKQSPLALEKLGIGKSISADEARAGDFCQFWRTSKTGHSVVFLNWVEKDGKRVGMHYRSSQELTKGISDRTEFFADTGIDKALIIRDRMYFGRLNSGESGR